MEIFSSLTIWVPEEAGCGLLNRFALSTKNILFSARCLCWESCKHVTNEVSVVVKSLLLRRIALHSEDQWVVLRRNARCSISIQVSRLWEWSEGGARLLRVNYAETERSRELVSDTFGSCVSTWKIEIGWMGILHYCKQYNTCRLKLCGLVTHAGYCSITTCASARTRSISLSKVDIFSFCHGLFTEGSKRNFGKVDEQVVTLSGCCYALGRGRRRNLVAKKRQLQYNACMCWVNIWTATVRKGFEKDYVSKELLFIEWNYNFIEASTISGVSCELEYSGSFVTEK